MMEIMVIGAEDDGDDDDRLIGELRLRYWRFNADVNDEPDADNGTVVDDDDGGNNDCITDDS